MSAAWIYLILAIGLGVSGTLLLKISDGFRKRIYGVASLLAYCSCFLFFAPALKVIPTGVAYAIWSGVGIAIVTLFGRFVFKQSLRPVQYGFIVLILAGAIGLNLTTQPLVN